MDGDRISRALARIEAASRRIEDAGARPSSAAPPAGDADLERRHAVLRSEAGAALTRPRPTDRGPSTMSNVTIDIAGRKFTVACGAGEEAHIETLGLDYRRQDP